MPAVRPEDADVPELDDAETLADLVDDDVEPMPDDGPENGDRIEFVRTGLIRVHIGATRYRLRRPFFGEFKKLRLAVEDMNDEIQEAVDESLRVSRQITVEKAEHDDDDPDTFLAWKRDSAKRQRAASRSLTEVAEARRVEWWETMWTLLTVDGRPDDWPSWITDPALAGQFIGHWRAVPLARG